MTVLEIILLCISLILGAGLAFSIKSTRHWIQYARELNTERHVRGPAPEELF